MEFPEGQFDKEIEAYSQYQEEAIEQNTAGQQTNITELIQN